MMKEKLKAAISRHAQFSQPEWEEILQHFIPMIVPQKTPLVQVGQVARFLYFIDKGAIRSYYKKGREENTGFYFEGRFTTALSSFAHEVPSQLYIETMEQTGLFSLSKEAYNLLNHSIEKFNVFTMRFSIEALIELNQNTDLLLATPEERLRIIATVKPQFISRVPLRYLSSFLQIPRRALFNMLKKYEWRN